MIDQPARHTDVTHEFDDGRGSDQVSPEHRRAVAGRGWSGVGALGALSFGLVHFYWAVGGRLGLPAEVGPISDRTWFLVYDLVAGLAFVVFAVGAGVLAAGRGSRRLQVWLVRAAAWGGVLALVRGGLGLVQDVVLIDEIGVGALYDVVFTAGGLIFLWSAYPLRSARRALTDRTLTVRA